MSDFTIQPAPAHPPKEGGGLNPGLLGGPAAAFHVPGPQIPNPATLQSLGPAATREELEKREKELNKCD
ncbi:hypothetical protein CTheo_5181 [Ceratobasidium theobromae]|uniref:Uncharacterized protein n=1 Tax=Ceratobasidium theobromae TaxID=1582974 RepID=A0A5N5QI31_9AGAM|nr:hypothetical protein CTheo_5181 [Ceratobasidium theobromae]